MRPLVVFLGMLIVGGCRAPEAKPELTVFAASSLVDVMGEITRALAEPSHDVRVRVNTAGSQILRLQAVQGADFDFFVSADKAHADSLHREGLIERPRPFLFNDLVVIFQPVYGDKIRGATDIGHAQRIALAHENVPLGRYTDAFLRAASSSKPGLRSLVRSRLISEESNARLVRAKVLLGEADAAVVYRSDLWGYDSLGRVPVPTQLAPKVTYYIGQRASPSTGRGASAFVEFLSSNEARAIFERHGFRVGP